MRYQFRSEQWLPYPVEHVFSFFSDPANLPRLMPDWQRATIIRSSLVAPPAHDSGPGHPVAGVGSLITLSFRPFPCSPLRFTWDAEIDQFVWNDHFCDLQLRGPFAYWHHCHSVSSETRSGVTGTLVRDELEYEPPFGVLGQIANLIGVRWQIRSIFAFRHRRTAELIAR